MIEKIAKQVINEGLHRQVEFNNLFLLGLQNCISAIEIMPNFLEFQKAVHRVIKEVAGIDPACANALDEYIQSLITEADNMDADFETWSA